MCKDCKFYLPVDVFSGICKISKGQIKPDDAVCDQFDRIAKCKFCNKYYADTDYLGKCMKSYLAYPDLVAIKCADFAWAN